jgi:glycosyltransferase involved in cell wall biosynthesis
MITVVIPAYRSSESLPVLLERLEKVLSQSGRKYEVVVVDDCSPDDTWLALMALKANRPWLKIIRLLRNSGQHNALLCGFSIAKGDVIVTMDDDLQNPPEEIPGLVAQIDEGYDLAIGSYGDKQHTRGRNLAGGLIDDLQRSIFGLPKDFQLTSFRAVRRAVIDNVVAMSTAFPYITSMLLSHTSRYVNVPVRHDPRSFGQSNYNLSRSLRLAFNLLLNYSSYPLYFVIALCLVALSMTFGIGAWVLWRALAEVAPVPGWASTIVAISFFNGLILLALVAQSLYLSRLTQQVSRSRVGFTIGELHD